MVSISLRAYNREIENQINSGRYEEAIAHCRHILQFFPKHIDTYRLLGKAFLESQRYSDAADIFQRVLSSIPDDFISHVGMSIIREDEGNLDAALWHMECAYEIQPSNAAIQEELRRLYGRRDGQEPSKIHLSRGALARMYAKGNLYNQAITELLAALSEDPQRPDLQVLLAKMYHQTGEHLKAVETCNLILKNLPFCLQANWILADILTNTNRTSEAQTYLQRVYALDPYTAHTSSELPSAEDVPDSAITLERLEWIPGQEMGEIPSQLEWAQSLGIKLDQISSKTEEIPEWLSTNLPKVKPFENIDEEFLLEYGLKKEEESVPEIEPVQEVKMNEPELPEEKEQPEEQTPEWQQPTEWMTEKPSEEEPSRAIEEGKEELTPASIPEWLKSLAPKETAEAETVEVDRSEWLIEAGAKLEGKTGEEEVLWTSKTPSSETASEPIGDDTTLAWLESLAAKQGVPEEELLTRPEERTEELPDWLQEIVKDIVLQ